MTKKVFISLIIFILALTSFAFAYENDEDINMDEIFPEKKLEVDIKTLPYYELIEKGILYKRPGSSEWSWTIKKGKVGEVAYSPLLKNQSDRLIFVSCRSLDDEGTLDDEGIYFAGWKLKYPEDDDVDYDSQEYWESHGIHAGCYHNLVSINGEPWQNTKYKDMYLNELLKNDHELKDLSNKKYILNPKYDGNTELYLVHHDGVDMFLNSDKMIVRYELKTYEVKLPTKVFADAGHTMIPLRGVLEHLGAEVGYNPQTKGITIKDKGHTVILKQGSNIATVDGKEKKMPKSVYTRNGHTMIPLKFVSENLDHGIGFFPEDGNMVSVDRAK